MDKNVLLSICIPTYNRAHYLRDCLMSITSQLKYLDDPDCVEIVVSDNASPDNTGEVAEEFGKMFNNVKYFRNDKNLLFDGNVYNSVDKASGFYCWTLGDDDVICPGGLKFVVDYLSKNKVAVLTVKSKEFTTIENIFAGNNHISDDSVYYTDSFSDFFWGDKCLGILSVLLFERNAWLENATDDVNILGWLYYGALIKMMPRVKSGFAYIDFPIVHTRQECAWSVGGTELTAYINWRKLEYKMTDFGYDRKTVLRENKKISRRLMVMLLRAKGHDLKINKANLLLIWKNFYNDPINLIPAVLVFFVPNGIIKKIRDFNKKFLKIKL